MTAIIEDPIQLRSKILVWAITTNVTDLIETMPPLGNYTSGVQSKKKITNAYVGIIFCQEAYLLTK